MTGELYRILQFLTFLPVYLTTFIGIGLILRLRRTHPKACWFAVGAGAVMFLNWGMIQLMYWGSSGLSDWRIAQGLDWRVMWLAFDAVLSVLQTASVALLIAAILAGRRPEP
ncbi:MAG: hypothetical protein M3552_11210 [Planctomycetota bacterium]|nr:hypothetical protein [Planctomycetaceae bacterium]MDQ3331205.1 hypothetical protein [Planctomycetota bacterium]